ncbi:Uncharacterised protein [Mycobacteroides abscessus]|nr:Uncharacterised protein [Mycobacteroides abscessus]CPS17585.1 Uncharacterised protein [Mycobacteroides abscessus]CPS22740.1 Uncharacterised protein [Mycobacteroides abscessus]CPS90627.1 Uncharacterised protein [Mycobacteroides abscessus]CPT45570.1 Uncharacterised protein [Mycobacteroides abscessus]
MDMTVALMLAHPTLYWMNKRAVDTAVGLAARGVPNHTTEEILASSEVAENGFLCFEKPIGMWRWQGVDVPLDGLIWGTQYEPRSGRDRFCVDLLSRITGHREMISDLRRDTPLIAVNGLYYDSFEVMWQSDIPAPPGAEYVPTPDEWGRLTSLIASVLLTLGQPRMVSQRVLSQRDGVVVPREVDGAKKNSSWEVVLIDLLRPPHHNDAGKSGRHSREYDHRWWVKGHWKMQPCGPGNSLRKIIYVEPHTKGPAEKALVNPARVNVIRSDASPPT